MSQHSHLDSCLLLFVVSTGTGTKEYVEKGFPHYEDLRLEQTQIISTHMDALLQC